MQTQQWNLLVLVKRVEPKEDGAGVGFKNIWEDNNSA